MALTAKQLSHAIPGSQIAFVRFCVGLAARALAWLRLPLRVGSWRGLLLRGLFGGGAVLFLFMSFEHLPVGLATLLNYTSPVFTTLWAALFLGENVGAAAISALIVTTAGVGLVIKGNAPDGTLGFGPWVLLGIFSAALSGAAVATIREVRRTDGTWEIFGIFCLVGALITGVPATQQWVHADLRQWLLMLLVGLFALGGQLLMTWSLRYLKAGIAGILQQLTPVTAIVLGWLLLGERTAGLALVGAAVTVSGVIWGARIAAREEPPPGP